jgi:hypothetical protein
MAKTSSIPSELATPVRPIAFGETAGDDVFNASELIGISDSRFLFCDNNINQALLELRLGSDGTMVGSLVKHPLHGIPDGTVDDMEGMTMVEHRRRKYLFVAPSFSMKVRQSPKRAKKKRDRAEPAPARAGLLRIAIGRGTSLQTEIIPNFRKWFVANTPAIGKAARWIPDDGGLNVEGLSWDPTSRALVFGLRTPVPDGRPLLVRVRVKDVAGPWSLDNLEMLEPVSLQIDTSKGEQGVRSIEYDPSRGASLVVVGNSTSASKAPFRLYLWDGNERGEVKRFADVRFAKKMKVEGVSHGTIAGRGAVVFVDDGGGYRAVWDDDPRLGRLK